MFTNIGGKLKSLAKVAAWLGIIASVISGISVMSTGGYAFRFSGGMNIIIGVVIILMGALAAWLSSLALYGFGELIEKTSEITENTRKQG